MNKGPVNPMSPSWPVGALSLLLFGGSGTAMGLWNIWALGYISMGNALNLMLLIGLLLTGFYGVCAVRFYRGLNPPDMPYMQKWFCVLAWFLLLVILFRRLGDIGVINGLGAMCLLVYTFFGFLGLVMCGKDRLRMLIVTLNTLCGLAGWAIFAIQLLRLLELFILDTVDQESGILTAQFQTWLYNLNSVFGLQGTIVFAVCLIIFAYLVRCACYYIMSPVPLREFFGKLTILSIVFFYLVYGSSFLCLKHCQSEFEIARIGYESYINNIRAQFADEMMNSDEAMRLINFEDTIRDDGEEWYNNVAEKLKLDETQHFNWDESAHLRWIPAPVSAEWGMKHLDEYFNILNSHYGNIEKTFGNVPVGCARVPRWLRHTTAWRMQYFMQKGNWHHVRKCMSALSRCIACDSEAALDDTLFGHSEDVWFAMGEILLEDPQCHVAILDDIRRACNNYAENTRKYEILRLGQVGRALCATAESVMDGGLLDLHRMKFLVPHLAMTAYASSISAMKYTCNLRNMRDLTPYVASNSPMANMTAEIYHREFVRHWQMTSRMNAMKLQVCIELYRRKYGKFPETLTQLIPEFIKSLPLDPVAPEKPYTMEFCECEVPSWNYTVGKQGITSILALRVITPCGEAVTRRTDAPHQPIAVSTHDEVDHGKYLVIDISKGPNAASYPWRYENLTPDINNASCRTTEIWLRRIPAGSFVMGSPEGEVGRSNNETPRKVTIDQDIYIGIFECTQRQFELVMGYNPSAFVSDVNPVECVTLEEIHGHNINTGDGAPTLRHQSDMDSFLGRLEAKTGLAFELPTEAQWEYACRRRADGSCYTTALNSGKELTNAKKCPNLDELGRYFNNGGNLSKHERVGTYLPNEMGLYDMHGNVWEWCHDWDNVYRPNTTVVIEGEKNPDGVHVIKGGSWFSDAAACRAGFYANDRTAKAANYIGFRLVYIPCGSWTKQ
jgi:formylglycine-generating enzyme required for sulfatase activity